ncbi:MAG: HAD hydrolase-like protein [Blautia sp.]|nr:HAD hydrolase-like protein [Blautia sp.]
MKYTTVLFDLDGTLTESGEGIAKSVQYALEKQGIQEENLEKLKAFVGPPLIESFMKYYGMTRETAEKSVVFYREYFRKKGIFENAVYPGIPEMLKNLKDKGYLLAVASSKPEPFVRQIMDYFALTPFFDEITGSTLDEKRTAKVDVIEETLRRMGLSDRRDEVVMVGDKEHDVLGAAEAGLDCIGVLYGYGTREELEAAKPAFLAETVSGLMDLL